MTPSLQDTLDITKPTNSSPENIGGLAYKQTFDNMSMDAKPANELKFTETNLMHRYTLTKYPHTPGNTFPSISSDPYWNPTDIMPY